MSHSSLLWAALAGVNLVALLAAIRLHRSPGRPDNLATATAVNEPSEPRAEPPSSEADDRDAFEALLHEADRAEARLFRGCRGEQRLAQDVARWRSECGGDSLPGEDTTCRPRAAAAATNGSLRRKTGSPELAWPLIGGLQ